MAIAPRNTLNVNRRLRNFFIMDQLINEQEEMILLAYIMSQEECTRQKKPNPTRVKGFVEVTIPRYTNLQFQSHFRMERETFEGLRLVLGPHVSSKTVSLDKKLLATLWLLANQESFRGVADRFNLNKGFLHHTVMEVCTALELVAEQFISWPSREEQAHIALRIQRKSGFPNVVGCIDGTHIQIPAPSEQRGAYYNRKKFPSIQLQAVCDDRLLFRDVYTGWPGSVADARVFRNSDLRAGLEAGDLEEKYHLLGDSGYGLAPYLMVPFRDNGHLSELQVHYNQVHSSARVVIERAFGLLKNKFRRMFFLDMKLEEKIPLIILSACVLHNFILIKEKIELDLDIENIVVADDVPQEIIIDYDDILPVAKQKRNAIANSLV